MKDKRKREGIEMIAINARTSPIELKEPGKLRLVSEENNNNGNIFKVNPTIWAAAKVKRE